MAPMFLAPTLTPRGHLVLVEDSAAAATNSEVGQRLRDAFARGPGRPVRRRLSRATRSGQARRKSGCGDRLNIVRANRAFRLIIAVEIQVWRQQYFLPAGCLAFLDVLNQSLLL